MSDDVEDLASGTTGQVLRAIADDPYIVENDLTAAVDADDAAVEAALATLSDADAIVGLTRGGDSELESRVPQTAYVLNPDHETALRDALDTGGNDG